MATVFLSYDREDAGKARPIAVALEKAGHSVWWDLHVRGGAQFSKVIEEELKAADAVVVLWSKQSVESAWVRDEAAAGRDAGRLVPVSLDNTEPPLGFRQFQTIALRGWKGRGRVPHLSELIAAVEEVAGRSEKTLARPAIASSDARERILPFLPVVAAALAMLVIAAGLLLWRPWAQGSPAPIVAVVAAQENPQSSALARDLLVQLGKFQRTNPDALKLVGNASESPDVILEASASAQASETIASLVLLSGKDRALLWSKDYSQPADQQADLWQQVAHSAAQVLRCAGESLATGAAALQEDVRKLYLNGCAQQSEGQESDPAAVAIFEKVTQANPRFRPGWEKLLLASITSAQHSRFEAFPAPGADPKDALRRHIVEATRHFSDMPEIVLARAELLPEDENTERLALMDRAKRQAPINPVILGRRSHELMLVGRMSEALADAERAYQLDPLSPQAWDSFITALTYSGRLTAAQEALEEAERVRPGSSSVREAKFRFHLRYGDPRVALEILRLQTTRRALEMFLRARIDPTPQNIQNALRLSGAVAERFEDHGWLVQALVEFGRNEEIHSTLAARDDSFVRSGFAVLFRPQFKKFREDPRFLQLTHRAGLLDYWRNSGHWPDFCAEPDLPYDCKKEAAKLMQRAV